MWERTQHSGLIEGTMVATRSGSQEKVTGQS